MILVVEDDPLIAMDIERILKEAGHTVQAINTYAEALKFYDANASAITHMYVDHQLPGERTGMDLHDHVRTTNKTLPFALVTGYGPEVLGSRQLKGTPFGFVSKPFLPEHIAQLASPNRPLWGGIPVRHTPGSDAAI